jgi:crotonobetainyl-CoA:carnitine CoA-transferase CaiB-like acyl-CoA transferase
VTGPLAGIKVLDLSQVIAGPFISVLLAHAGAEVIKIESLQGEIARSVGNLFVPLNWGKRSLPLNLQTEEGQEVFHRLATKSDVVVQNFRPGVAERLKIDYWTLASINPRLIYCSITAFGSSGPYSHRPGFDPLIQAITGIERSQGGPHNPPVFMRIAITDYATAMIHAAAITMALYNRERTGKGEHIIGSLLRSGIFINGDVFTRYAGRRERPLPDAAQTGLGPLDRMYQASDGWVFIVVEDNEVGWRRLVSVPGLDFLAEDERFGSRSSRSDHADALGAALEKAFVGDAAESWLAALESRGVPSAPVVVGYDQRFFEDVQPMINHYTVWGEHSLNGRVEHSGNYIGYQGWTPEREGRTAPELGQHTSEILGELGYSGHDVERMRAGGVIL